MFERSEFQRFLNFIIAQGSHKNKLAILNVEAPAWLRSESLEYLDIPSFRNVARQDASALKNVKLFLREPSVFGRN